MRFLLTLLPLAALLAAPAKLATDVTLMRVPDGGIQPQVAVDPKGAVHMIYYAGDALGGDVFYVRSRDGVSFSKPIRVNTQAGSAVAAGNIRGAHIALGHNGRVHVAWMGSKNAQPKGPAGKPPMLYTRLNDSGAAFEPERNIIQFAYGLDGGGTVAADACGNAYVIWHAPEPGTEGEGNRRVWVARSTDEGRSFQRERMAWSEPTGVCGCCGIGAITGSKGTLYVQYRSATNVMDRDTYVLVSKDHGQTFTGAKVDSWKVGTCVMSTQALIQGVAGILMAWETKGQIYYSRSSGKPVAAPGNSEIRKHPALASNSQGDTILAWTEGMAWKKGGSLAWQVYDQNGKAKGEAGSAPGVPAFSLIAAFARPDGGFTVVY
jgi:hypothetical protein